MNPADARTQLPPEALAKALGPCLFPDQEERLGTHTFAILDGASIPDLLDHLYGDPRPEFECLYRGELEPDIAEIAPYLVRLEDGHPFTAWMLTEGWGKHWGIFALSPSDLKAMRKHFRTYLMVKTPEGQQVYFRYYDPRVMRVYLPTCNAAEIATVFGPTRWFLMEEHDPARLLRFSPVGGRLKPETIKLSAS